jgi:hypothetical protein
MIAACITDRAPEARFTPVRIIIWTDCQTFTAGLIVEMTDFYCIHDEVVPVQGIKINGGMKFYLH